MNSGTIRVAEHRGVFIVKMLGDVRLNLGVEFHHYIDEILSNDDVTSVVFDLENADVIDSTTLGLMAKIAITSQERSLSKPLAISPNASVRRLLETMGFSDLLAVIDDHNVADVDCSDTIDLTPSTDEAECCCTVLAAHRALVELNSANEEKFKELIHTLESADEA